MAGPAAPPADPGPVRSLPDLWALRDRAQEHNNAGRHAEAADTYRTLVARLGELSPAAGVEAAEHTELGVRARVGLAFVAVTRGRLRQGLDLLARAAAHAGTDRPELQALVVRQRAVLLANVGRLHDALAEMQSLRAVEAQLPEQDLIIVLLNRALLHGHLGNAGAAAADNARLLALATPERYPTEHFMATYNSGMIAFLEGDLPTALATMARADAMDVPVTRNPGRLDQGKVLMEAGLVDEAIELLSAAAPEGLAAGQSLLVSQLETTLSHALRLAGRHQDALAAAVAAEAHLGADGAGPQGDPARLAALAARLTLGDQPARIHRAAAGIARRARTARSVLDLPAHLLAAEAALLDTPAAAERMLDRTRLPASASLSERLRWRRIRAVGALAGGDLARTRRELRQAARELGLAQSRIVSLDLGTARALHTEPLVQVDIEVALRSGPAAVFAATERWRAATAALAAVRPPEDPEMALLVARLRAAHAQRDAPAGGAATRGDILAIQRAIRSRDWAVHPHGHSDAAASMTFGAARARLAEDAADVCSFFRVEDRVQALVLGQGPARLVDCLQTARAVELVRRIHADLRVSLTQAPGVLTAAVRASLAAELAELDETLLAAVRGGDRRLVLVPTRPISGVPWGLLPSLAGRPVTVARSITTYLARAALDPVPVPRLALVAGPGLGQAAAREGAHVADAWRRRGGIVDRMTTRGETQDAVRSGDVVHIAAHGHHEPRSPLFSRLELADGPLYAHDLQSGGVAARHIVLAACEVGRATPRPGEESLGFAATLLALGANCVVAAHTSVPDDLAAAVMARYHRRLAAGTSSDEALAAAIAGAGGLAGVFAAFGSRCVV